MTEKYRVHEFVRFDYSEIGEYVDEYHTDRPLRNDQLVNLLNGQDEQIKELEKVNENLNNVLEDFMVMLNRLQADSNNEVLQSIAKDMLRMMGKDIIGDSE